MNILRHNCRLLLSNKQVIINQDLKAVTAIFTRFKSDIPQSQSVTVDAVKLIKSKNVPTKVFSEKYEDNFIVKLLRKIPFIKLDNIKVKHAGYMLYEDFVDVLDYSEFFEEFVLTDTFYSWFVVTELHIWILSTRAMAEGDLGNSLRNSVVECFWIDVTQRIKSLGIPMQADIKQQISEMSEQLQAAFIGYDEGLQSDDIVLAGALWRRMYGMETVHPEYLEKLVKYVRKKLVILDSVSSDNLFRQRHINWRFQG